MLKLFSSLPKWVWFQMFQNLSKLASTLFCVTQFNEAIIHWVLLVRRVCHYKLKQDWSLLWKDLRGLWRTKSRDGMGVKCPVKDGSIGCQWSTRRGAHPIWGEHVSCGFTIESHHIFTVCYRETCHLDYRKWRESILFGKSQCKHAYSLWLCSCSLRFLPCPALSPFRL